MAELLVKAKPHWMDSLDPDKIDPALKGDYDSRAQVGDIIVVMPDGHEWGKAERLPNFIVVKVPDMKYEDAKKFEEPLLNLYDFNQPIHLRDKKHAIPKTVVQQAIQDNQSVVEIDKSSFEKDILITKEV